MKFPICRQSGMTISGTLDHIPGEILVSTLQTTENIDTYVKRHSPSRGDFSAAAMRNQLQVHDLILRAVESSGFSQKELASRIGMDEASLSRAISSPKNLELNTISKIIYAACGAAIRFSLSYPQSARSTPTLILSAKYSAITKKTDRESYVYNQSITAALAESVTTDLTKLVVDLPMQTSRS